MTKRQQEPTQLDEWPTWREDLAGGRPEALYFLHQFANPQEFGKAVLGGRPNALEYLQQFANPQEFGKAVFDELGPYLDRRGPIAPILRQKFFWPAGRRPVGYEITCIGMQIYERILAVSKYYKVYPGSPAWDATWQKAKKRFEGLKPMTNPGQTARPKQAYDDLFLVVSVDKTVANGGTVTDAIKVIADQRNDSFNKLRIRYYKLTRPRSIEDHRSRKRMQEAIARTLDYLNIDPRTSPKSSNN